MKYQVHILKEAEEDLYEIYIYVATKDSPVKAKTLLNQLETACSELETSPLRGRIPPELNRIGISHYRELIFKVYRIIYAIQNKEVYIHCVLDGRRDLQDLLERRLVRSG